VEQIESKKKEMEEKMKKAEVAECTFAPDLGRTKDTVENRSGGDEDDNEIMILMLIAS
jgi:hypothetical protein